MAPFSPFWRRRLADLGRTPEQVSTAEDLRSLPAVGERDVCPDGDPAAAAALVLQSGESGYALHADGPAFRRALVRRATSPGAYAQVVEQDTRPTTFVWAGRSLAFPVASTRGDLDVVAPLRRACLGGAGARQGRRPGDRAAGSPHRPHGRRSSWARW